MEGQTFFYVTSIVLIVLPTINSTTINFSNKQFIRIRPSDLNTKRLVTEKVDPKKVSNSMQNLYIYRKRELGNILCDHSIQNNHHISRPYYSNLTFWPKYYETSCKKLLHLKFLNSVYTYCTYMR